MRGKGKRKRGAAKAVRQEGAPHAESEKRPEWPWTSEGGAAAGGPQAEGNARRDARATNPQPASVVLSPAHVDRRASESSRGSLSTADSNKSIASSKNMDAVAVTQGYADLKRMCPSVFIDLFERKSKLAKHR